MTLYEAIYSRRQVRKYNSDPLEKQVIQDIFNCVTEADQLTGQNAVFEIVSVEAVNGGNGAPHFLLGSCDDNFSSYANVGYVMQKADLYIQSIGLGSGWFMSAQPKDKRKNHCITFAFGATDTPIRKSAEDFKRLPLNEICDADTMAARAVWLAPSAMNSQPWQFKTDNGKVIIHDKGRGAMRMLLKNKLNKVDVGIAARHAVTALTNEGKTVSGVVPVMDGKEFTIQILYR